MGFFDRFGAGGGDLTVQLSAPEFSAGGTVSGTVTFTGGKRPQNINGISVKLVCNLSQDVKTPQGVQRQSQQREAGNQQLAGRFQSNPGQRYDMPFQIGVPSDAPGSNRGTVEWRLAAVCDIDGEVDDGAGIDVIIRGGAWGAQPQPQMQGAMGAMGAAGAGAAQAHADPAAQKAAAMKQQAIAAQTGTEKAGAAKMAHSKGAAHDAGAAKAAAVAHDKKGGGGGGVFAPGTAVMAQWQDGNWYRARVAGFQNGMYGIDWDDPKLGASTWCATHQVRSA